MVGVLVAEGGRGNRYSAISPSGVGAGENEGSEKSLIDD